MKILAYFADDGTPATGLTPACRVLDLADNSLADSGAMSEVGDGAYKFEFATYDSAKEYAVRCDGGATLDDHDRYTYGANPEGLVENKVDALNDLAQSDILADATPFDGADVAAILDDTLAMNTRLPTDPADESLQQAAHTATQGAVAGLTDIDQAGVQAALTAQGYTVARGPMLDHLDTDVSSRSSHAAADVQALVLSDATPFPGAHVDAAVTSRSAHSAADVDTQLSGVHGAASWEGDTAAAVADAVWDEARGAHTGGLATMVDNLDQSLSVTESSIRGADADDLRALSQQLDTVAAKTNALPTDPADESLQQAQHAATQALVAALTDIDQAGVQSAMTAQGYTPARGAGLDNLDQSLSATESSIRGADGDSLKTLSDEIAALDIPASDDVLFTRRMEEGRWEITSEGGGTMVFYQADNATEVARFALYDALGQRSTDPAVITKRERI